MRQALRGAPVRRTGLGIGLLVSVAILTALSMLAIVQLSRSSNALHEAARDAGGALAEEVACSAVEEALWRLQMIFTDPQEPLFWQLRRELISGRRPALDLSHDLEPVLLLERLRAAPADSPLRFVNLVRFIVTFHIPNRHVSTDQFVDFDVAASLSVSSQFTYRRVCQRRRYGLTLVSTYKPFDQLTLAILDHGAVERFGQEVRDLSTAILTFNLNASLVRGLGELAQGAPTSLPSPQAGGDAGSQLVSMRPPFVQMGLAPPIPSWLGTVLAAEVAALRRRDSGFDSMLAAMTQVERSWFEWQLLLRRPETRVRLSISPLAAAPRQAAIDPIQSRILSSDVPTSGSIVFSTSEQVNLSEFDYEVRLRTEYEEPHRQAESRASRLNRLWARYVTAEPTRLGVSETAQLLDELATATTEAREGVVAVVGALNPLTRHLVDHTRLGFRSDALEGYLKKSSRRLKSLGHHLTRPAELSSLFEDYPSYSGHIAYYGLARLTVRARGFSGKAILSTPFSNAEYGRQVVSVEELSVKDPSSDLLVLEAGHLELPGGTVDGSIFCRDRLAFKGEPDIRGNLIIQRLLPLRDRRPDEELHGKVTYRPTVWSGTFWERTKQDEKPRDLALDHYVLTLCPRDTRRVVLRNREGR